MSGHVTLPCEVYIFIFDNDWAWSVGLVFECQAGMLVNVGSIFLGQNFFG